jgi:hypothetical protein
VTAVKTETNGRALPGRFAFHLFMETWPQLGVIRARPLVVHRKTDIIARLIT